jgi:phosphopantetheinyl transferase
MRDHSIEGTPVLAGVLTLEAFTEAARLLAPEATDFEIRDARFAYAVKLLRGPLSVSVYAERRGGAIHCSASTLPPAPPGVQPARRVHAEATLVPTASPTTSSGFLGGLPPLRSDGDPGSRASTWNLPKDAIYRAFFHGPCFQVLRRGRTLGAATVSAEAEVPPLPAPAFPAGLMEAAFQTLGAWGLAVPRVMALPHKVERIAWSPRARDGKSAAGTVEIYGMRVENDLLVGDAIVRDREGTPMVRAEGIHLIVTGEVAASEALPAPLPPAVSFETIRGRKVARVDIGAVAHDPAAFVPWLPRSEREQASQLHVEKRYVEYVAGGVALRAVGSRRVDGKPDGASLSHAGDWAAALSFDRTSERVGIDVERIEARPDAFLREAFTESERRRLANPTDITRAWCAKEALLKAIGTGLKADLHQIEVSLEAGSITVDASGAVKSAIAELGARNVEFAETAWEGHRVVLATLPLR